MKKLTRQQLLDYYFSGLDIEFDDSLFNLQRYSVSISVNMEQLNDFNKINKIHQLDPEQIYTKALYEEMASGISKSIRKEFTQIGKIVDLSSKSKFIVKELGNFMKSLNEKNYITCHEIATTLEDLENFSPLSISSYINVYPIGKLDDKKISIDSYMKYNDCALLSYDKVKVNLIIDEPQQVIDPITCNTRTILSYRIDFSVVNPKINYVILEDSSVEIKEKVKGELIRLNRDKVLNILLND